MLMKKQEEPKDSIDVKEQKRLEQVKPLLEELRAKYERDEITRENLLDSILKILDWFFAKKK